MSFNYLPWQSLISKIVYTISDDYTDVDEWILRSTEKARQAILQQRETEREARGLQLYDYIRLHPGETSYSLAKQLHWPLRSVQSLLEELEADSLIKNRRLVENGRLKREFFVMEFEDFDFVDYDEDELNDPLIQQLLERTKNHGVSVFIHRNDGTTLELKPE